MRTLLGIAALAGMLAGLASPALAQPAPAPPDKTSVPNSGTKINCNANGTGTATNGPNAESPASSNVAGTPVTNVNPNGAGTTSTQTPSLQKPVKADVQCAKTQTQQNEQPAAPQSSSTSNAPSAPMMNALHSNPNGSNWLQKFNRPSVTASHKTKMRHAKRATGGGS
jgi:hypothetical protein